MSTKADESSYSSETVPDAALFVAADEPLLVFPSAAAAEQHLEAVDVEHGVYPAAYGPDGRPYRVTTRDRQVVIEATGEAERPDELRALLLRYLEGARRGAEASASLRELVAEVWTIERDFWQEHDPFGERFGSRMPLWGCLAILLVSAVILYLFLS